ncbi:MAG: nucleotidyltransferase domain-containing protein [bacterium]
MIEKKLQIIRDYFKNKPINKAYLFGSHVTDDADDTSDIDILIELDHSQPIGLQFVKMQLELEKILKKKVDLLTERSVSKYIRPYIENKKKLIYEK